MESHKKNSPTYYIGCGTVKDLRYIIIKSVNSLCLVFHKINRSIEESNLNKYRMLVPTDGSKDTSKNYE